MSLAIVTIVVRLKTMKDLCLPWQKIITTNVVIPRDIEAGESELFVVANGISSEAFRVNIKNSRNG